MQQSRDDEGVIFVLAALIAEMLFLSWFIGWFDWELESAR